MVDQSKSALNAVLRNSQPLGNFLIQGGVLSVKNYVDILRMNGLLPQNSDWVTGSSSPRSLWNNSVRKTIQNETGVDLKPQFWMRDKRLDFEFAYHNKKKCTIESKDSKKREIANNFVKFILSKNPPTCLDHSEKDLKKATVVHVSNENDADMVVFFKFIRGSIIEWASTDLYNMLNQFNEIGMVVETKQMWLQANEADLACSNENEEYSPQGNDRRRRVERQILERRGQGEFRNHLRNRYGDRCLVTGCEVLDVLEAAHISPYRGKEDNHPQNGLLLRSDIHTLFDLDLLGIEPEALRVELHPDVNKGYGQFAGKTLTCVKEDRPSREALQQRYEQFKKRRGKAT